MSTSANLFVLKKDILSEYEESLLRKWKINKIMQWIFLIIIVVVFDYIMGWWILKEMSLEFNKDIILEILLFLFFLCIPILFIKKIKMLLQLNIPDIKICRAIITEKKSVRSREVITRKRNRFVAAKITDSITLYANCNLSIYKRTIVNKTKGLFFTVDDGKMRVLLLERD